MKLAAIILLLVAALLGAVVHTFRQHFTIVPTVRGDEYLILRAEQAAECQLGGGCAVFSEREWLQAVQQLVLELHRREKGGS